MFSENKTGQKSGDTDVQKALNASATFAINKLEGYATDALCAELRADAYGIIPVCKIVEHLAKYIAKTWDLGDNQPSN